MKAEIYNQVFRYFNSEMNESERKAFEASFHQDEELSREVESFKQIQSLSDSAKQKISTMAKITNEEKRNNQDLWNRIHQARQNFEILTEWEVLFDNNFQLDGTPEKQPASLEEAFDYYNMEEYEDAIEVLENIDTETLVVTRGAEENKELTEFYIYYYKALSLMAEDNFMEAIPELENAVIRSPDNYLKSKAQWYLALAQLKMNNLEETEVLLKEVANNEMAKEYIEKSLKLISELKKD